MYILAPLNDDPEAYDNLCRFLSPSGEPDFQPALVTLTDDGNVVRMDSVEAFYREELAAQPELECMTIRSWDDLTPADREAFAADLGRHIEWLFPETGALYYQPDDHILAAITVS